MIEHRDASGRLTFILHDDDRHFESYMSRLEQRCKAKIVEKLEDIDQRWWDYDIESVIVVLHSDPMAGISIHVEEGSHDEMLRSIAEQIKDQ
jgi:hypothetical protein